VNKNPEITNAKKNTDSSSRKTIKKMSEGHLESKIGKNSAKLGPMDQVRRVFSKKELT